MFMYQGHVRVHNHFQQHRILRKEGKRPLNTEMQTCFGSLRLTDVDNQTVPSWTGFNICVRDEELITEDVVGYLPTLNAPATKYSIRNSESVRIDLIRITSGNYCCGNESSTICQIYRNNLET
jgi:hypothetical protein